ncbi:MAG: phosphomannomutase/phosphoglucomutase [Candidatus Nanopelagicales bacterium]
MTDQLGKIFKAYDIRGLVDSELTEDLVQHIGSAFVIALGIAKSAGGTGAIVLGRDMRESGVGYAAAFAAGVNLMGVDVIDIGLASTDQLYFASGLLELPGAMLTASHNPAAYNGIKLCLAKAKPVGQETGLEKIKELVAKGEFIAAAERGRITQRDLLPEYANFLHELAGIKETRKLKIVVDAGNGMAGHTAPTVLNLPGIEMVPMYFELDGNFPNHEANPIDPKNLVELQQQVIATKADLGLAFDGDADRCFLVDDQGELVTPSALTALIAKRFLTNYPGSTIVHNLICSNAVPEIVAEQGGTPVRTRVGHSFIKQVMAETNAVFGGEHSGHFYFRDFWYADSGMLAALFAIAELSNSDQPFSSVIASSARYSQSGEINSNVPDVAAAIDRIVSEFAPGNQIDRLDGVTIRSADWWLNVRASNTEPLVRLNVEAADADILHRQTQAALSVIRDF